MADDKSTNSPQETPSDPPAVKTTKIHAATIQNLGALALVGFLSYAQKWSIEYTLGAIGVILGVVSVPMLFKRPPGSVGVLALAAKAGALLVGRSNLLVLTLALSVALSQASCAAMFAALPTIIAAAETASDVINAIDSFVQQREHDHAIDVAITKARAALIAVRRAAAGAKDLHDGDLQAALTEFQAAYQAVLDLVAPLGIHAPPDDGRLAAPSPGELIVPSAPALRLELEGQR
jgi:hypothetical protein